MKRVVNTVDKVKTLDNKGGRSFGSAVLVLQGPSVQSLTKVRQKLKALWEVNPAAREVDAVRIRSGQPLHFIMLLSPHR
ncbi:hypothetical protein BaRGS_00026349 [Batillaria attramentaria]|uniref:Uncharacterized protein n=1 Tax=Batillaria attramentaria TaxID=370345 RepID=A0ABD0K5S3_9CAEN